MAQNTKLAAKIVRAILTDVTDRRGWRQAWDGFDDDIKSEIKAAWLADVVAILDSATPQN